MKKRVIYSHSETFLKLKLKLIVFDALFDFTEYMNVFCSIRYPDDQFDRFWEPYEENVFVVASNKTPPVSGFWNIPPSKVFERALSTAQLEPLELRWPPFSLPNSTYYIALYFADNSDSIASSTRMLDIHINDIRYYGHLNVTSEGAVVFATRWPLHGPTKITLSTASNSNISPLINAGEIFDVLRLGGRTHTRDGMFPNDILPPVL